MLVTVRGVVVMHRELEVQGRYFQTNSGLRNKLFDILSLSEAPL